MKAFRVITAIDKYEEAPILPAAYYGFFAGLSEFSSELQGPLGYDPEAVCSCR
jgi:hypothetical protein